MSPKLPASPFVIGRPARGKMRTSRNTTYSQGAENIPIRTVATDIQRWLLTEDWKNKKKALLNKTREKMKTTQKKHEFGTHEDTDNNAKPRLRFNLTRNNLRGLSRAHEYLNQTVKDYIIPELVNKQRTYTAKDYYCISASIFVDPPGSSLQDFHDDIEGMDRHAVWNIAIPLQLPERTIHSDFSLQTAQNLRNQNSKGLVGQLESEAVMWDGNWLHRGTGNTTKVDKIQLHMVFAPWFMFVPPEQAETVFGGKEALNKILNSYGIKMEYETLYTDSVREIQAEYNFNESIYHRDTLLGDWVKFSIEEFIQNNAEKDTVYIDYGYNYKIIKSSETTLRIKKTKKTRNTGISQSKLQAFIDGKSKKDNGYNVKYLKKFFKLVHNTKREKIVEIAKEYSNKHYDTTYTKG